MADSTMNPDVNNQSQPKDPTTTSLNAAGFNMGASTPQPSIASQFNVGTPQTGTTGTTASSGTSLPSQLNQAATYNVNDPNFQNMSADQRLNVFKSNPALAQQELERVKGVYNQNANSGDTARLQQISTWANQVRQAAGINPNDPFYGNGPAPTADGTLGLNVNGQQENVPVYQGTSYDSAAKIAQELGQSYSVDPLTQMPVIGGKTFNAVTFDKNGNAQVPLKLVAESLGFKADWNPKTNSVTVTGGPKQQPQDQSMGMNIPGFNPGNPNALGSWSDYWNSAGVQQPQYMPIQSQFNPDWTTYYNQAHAQIDPLYQNQMNTLMSKQASDITGMDEKMNARGIFNSGIAQAAEDDLRAKTTNSVATLLTKQMSDIEKTAQTLFNQSYKQYSDGNTFALKYNQDQINNYMAQQKQIFSQWLSTQKLDLSQQQYALNAWDKMATLQLNQTKAMLPYQYQTANNQANNQASMQRAMLPYQYQTQNNIANNQASMDRAMLPYTMGPTPAQKLPYDQQTANDKANNELQLWKMLGYVQTPDGKMIPTEQATNDQRNYALNFAKMLGYVVNPDGSITKTEQAIHDRATETAAQDGLKLKLYDMMGFDQNGTPTLKREQLQQTIDHDKQMVDIAQTNATNSENKTVIDSIGKQLSAIDSQINALTATINPMGNASDNQQIQAQIKMLSDKRDTYLNQLSQYSNGGYYGNFQGASR